MGDKGGRKSKDKQTKQKASKQLQQKKDRQPNTENEPEVPGSEEGWQRHGIAHGPDYARDTIPEVGQEMKGFIFDPGMTGLAEEGPRITS